MLAINVDFAQEWKKVAGMVKTRTVVQTRTHAQKYFQKLTKSSGGGGSGGGGGGGNYSQSRNEHMGGGGASGQKGTAPFYHKQGKVGGRGGKVDPSMLSPPPLSHSHMRGMGVDPSLGMGMGINPMLLAGMGGMAGMGGSMGMGVLGSGNGLGGAGGGGGNTYMDAETQDYYDSLDLATLVGELHKTPAPQQQAPPVQMQTPVPYGLSLLHTSVGPPDFPEPSPAACGKRKHAELQAAQMLAASSSSKSRPSAPYSGGLPPPYNAGSPLPAGVQASALRGGHLTRDASGGSASGATFNSRRNRLGLTLSIVDPNEGQANSSNGFAEPGTPWETAITALEQQSASTAPINRLMRSNSFSNYTMPAVPCSTPSEQRLFLNKVRALVKDADLAGFASLLGAAEYSAQTQPSSGGESESDETQKVTEGGQSPVQSKVKDEAAVSNLMSVYTPDAPAGPREKREGSLDSQQEPVTPRTEALRKTEAENTHMNSSSNLAGAGLSRQFSSSLVAKSLNRIDRNSKSVLMDIASTKDPNINQTLLYSMCMLLIEHGANPSLVDGLGNTALHYAAVHGHERIGRLLLTKGCPMNLQNTEGDTATHIAARNGCVAFIEMLADLGANFHLRNGSSVGALDLAGSNAKSAAERDALRKIMLDVEPRLRSLILYHEDFLEHTARRPSDWEGPDRLNGIMERLRDKAEFPEHEVEISNRFEKADVTLLGRVHSPEYIAFVNMLSKQVQQEAQDLQDQEDGDGPPPPPAILPFTPQVQRFVMRQNSEELKSSESCDTSFSVGTLSAARRAAGAVAHAVDRVMLGRNRNVFCAVRPPGHHAGYRGLLDGANSCGFCIFNSVAAGALHALEEHQCERVAIVDLDVHHGNGTEDIVRRYAHPSRLFFFSLHLYDKEDPHSHGAPTTAVPVKTNPDRPIDAATGDTPAPAQRKYEFYPGTGVKDDHVSSPQHFEVPFRFFVFKISSSFSTGSQHHQRPTGTPVGERKQCRRRCRVKTIFGENLVILKNPLHPFSSLFSLFLSQTPLASQFTGREGYRQAIQLRLIPSLRAFNPTLILLSVGFDAAAGDVGNCRQFPGEATSRMGIDLQAEDFAWATTEIMKIADICCGGRLVSVLEGGYGEYAAVGKSVSAPHAPTTRGAARNTAPAPAVVEAEKVSFKLSRRCSAIFKL